MMKINSEISYQVRVDEREKAVTHGTFLFVCCCFCRKTVIVASNGSINLVKRDDSLDLLEKCQTQY